MKEDKILIISKESRCPFFGMKKWKISDYDTPLTFQLQNGIISKIYMRKPYGDEQEGINITDQILFELYFRNPPQKYTVALKSKGVKAVKFAKFIHELYTETYHKFESVLRTGGKVKNLFVSGPEQVYEFFSESGFNPPVEYRINNGPKIKFSPKLPKPRGRFALFKSPQLVTPEKWIKIQKEIEECNFPSEEILELHRIWGKLDFLEIRLPIVEAAIIVETILKEYAKRSLEKKRFSKNKIKDLKNDLTFNITLNLVLPLTLTKTETKRMSSAILKINKLRKYRNDIVHEDLPNDNIDRKEAKLGVEASIDLIEFIYKKMKNF